MVNICFLVHYQDPSSMTDFLQSQLLLDASTRPTSKYTRLTPILPNMVTDEPSQDHVTDRSKLAHLSPTVITESLTYRTLTVITPVMTSYPIWITLQQATFGGYNCHSFKASYKVMG